MRKYEFPPNHRPGMRVPTGGSSCSKCEYLRKDKKSCGNEYFIKWHGNDVIPAPVNEYCSDWFEPAKGRYRVHESHENNLMTDWRVNETY